MRNRLTTFETALDCSRRLHRDTNDAEAWHSLGTSLAALGCRMGAFLALRCFEIAGARTDA